MVQPLDDSLGPFPVAKMTGLLLADRLPITVAKGIPWDVNPFTDAKAVAAPESHVRLIFHVEVVGEGEATVNILSMVHFDLCDDTGSSDSGWRLPPVRERVLFFFAVIAGFHSFVFVDVIEKLCGFGGDGW
jgi:hypothetical protein